MEDGVKFKSFKKYIKKELQKNKRAGNCPGWVDGVVGELCEKNPLNFISFKK